MRVTTKKISIAALLLAVGFLLPQLFHLVGGQAAGGMFLPMHIPVLLAGLLLGPYFGAALWIVLPILSTMLTAMPPIAKLPVMLIELCLYGLVSGICQRCRWNVYLSLLTAQIVGRAAYATALVFATEVLKFRVSAPITVLTAITTGIFGIVLQLVLIPPIVILAKKVITIEFVVAKRD